MTADYTTLVAYVMDLLNDGMDREHIEAVLYAKGHDEPFVKTIVAETMKLRQTRLRSQGVLLILVGAVLCFLSFLFTITGSFSHFSFPWVLYGLTSAGIVVVFAGFTRIF